MPYTAQLSFTHIIPFLEQPIFMTKQNQKNWSRILLGREPQNAINNNNNYAKLNQIKDIHRVNMNMNKQKKKCFWTSFIVRDISIEGGLQNI